MSEYSLINDSGARAVVVFARAPVAGRVKSRLAAAIGADAAAALYAAFLDDTCALVSAAAGEGAPSGWRLVLAVDGDVGHPAVCALAARDGFERVAQGDGDLGARLDAAIARYAGGGAVVIVGSDAPTLPRARLGDAFAALADADVVLGPAADGGYYLIGARRAVPEIFRDMPWGTARVLAETRARLPGCAVLAPHYDIDERADLARLAGELRTLAPDVAPATRRALATVVNSC
jgi:uncharacterized protein